MQGKWGKAEGPGDGDEMSSASAVDSSKLITASADSSTKIWNVKTGECLFTFEFHQPCKAVAFSYGDEMAAISTDPFVQRCANSLAFAHLRPAA